MQRVAELDEDNIRCILTTDAEAAFQFASRRHCYEVLCSEATLKERFAPFFLTLTRAHSEFLASGKPATHTIFRIYSGRRQRV